MAQNASVIESGIDQIQEAVREVDRRFRRLQRNLATRRRRLEKQVGTRRRALERRAQKQVSRLRRNALVKRAEALRDNALDQVEHGVSTLMDTLPIATKGDLRRIDRKVSALNRKVRELERA